MTNEQREAIDKLTNGENMDFATLIRTFKKEGIENFAVVRKEYLDTVLPLIKEQQEEIAKYEKIYKEYDCYRWVKELNKKDKQIDLMAKKINEAYCDETSFYNWFEKTFGIRAEGDYSKEIKQYFAELAEKE